MKPTQKTRQRQRQRMQRRMILLFLGSFVVIATIVTTLVINTTRVEQSRAKSDKHENHFVVEDQVYTNTFTLSAPIMSKHIAPQEGTLLVRRMKKITPGSSIK